MVGTKHHFYPSQKPLTFEKILQSWVKRQKTLDEVKKAIALIDAILEGRALEGQSTQTQKYQLLQDFCCRTRGTKDPIDQFMSSLETVHGQIDQETKEALTAYTATPTRSSQPEGALTKNRKNTALSEATYQALMKTLQALQRKEIKQTNRADREELAHIKQQLKQNAQIIYDNLNTGPDSIEFLTAFEKALNQVIDTHTSKAALHQAMNNLFSQPARNLSSTMQNTEEKTVMDVLSTHKNQNILMQAIRSIFDRLGLNAFSNYFKSTQEKAMDALQEAAKPDNGKAPTRPGMS